MAERSSSSGGASVPIVLFIVFMTLKLSNVIDWSWWWVTSPLWVPFLAAIALLVVVFGGFGFVTLVKAIYDRCRLNRGM